MLGREEEGGVDTLDATCVTMETTQDTLKASAGGGTRSKEWRPPQSTCSTQNTADRGGTQGEAVG